MHLVPAKKKNKKKVFFVRACDEQARFAWIGTHPFSVLFGMNLRSRRAIADPAAVDHEPRRLIEMGDHAHLSVGDAYPIAMAVKIQNGPVIRRVVQSVLVEIGTPPMLLVNLADNNFPITDNDTQRFVLYGTPDDVTVQLAHLMRMSHDGASITWNDIAANVRHEL